jgi:RTX calcium-binding nonapeptide repeat (4 copies)
VLTRDRRQRSLAPALAALSFATAIVLLFATPGASVGLRSGASTTISAAHALSSAHLGDARPATAATVLTVSGGPIANRVAAFVGSTGRLTLTSPEGITAPPTPTGQCTQDTTVQISCDPGYVQVISGDLGASDDTFTASPDLPAMVGAVVDGQRRPLSGGPGRDRIVGGTAADLLEGGLGGDSLIGGGGDDLLSGGGGADRLRGGRGRDVLFGGNGRDRLDGGPGRDLCNGGPGRDVAAGCEVLRSVP